MGMARRTSAGLMGSRTRSIFCLGRLGDSFMVSVLTSPYSCLGYPGWVISLLKIILQNGGLDERT